MKDHSVFEFAFAGVRAEPTKATKIAEIIAIAAYR
jgi:hypothetical protein